MKVGDLVSAYWAGYYEIVKISRRWEKKDSKTFYERRACCITGEENFNEDTCGVEMNPLLTLIQKFTKEGKPVVTKKERTCDSSFCKPAEEYIAEEIKKLTTVFEQLDNVYKFHSTK